MKHLKRGIPVTLEEKRAFEEAVTRDLLERDDLLFVRDADQSGAIDWKGMAHDVGHAAVDALPNVAKTVGGIVMKHLKRGVPVTLAERRAFEEAVARDLITARDDILFTRAIAKRR